MQTSLFGTESPSTKPIALPMHDAEVLYFGAWLDPTSADHYYTALAQSLNWRQDTIKLYGKTHLIPRQQAWYGDHLAEYRYSGLTMTPQSWTPELATLKQKIELACQTRFNSVLANWYQHGQHSMGMHSDDEPELGENPVIASLTLGAERPFVFKHKYDKSQQRVTLQHGSLLIMRGTTQHYWQHGINKTAKVIDGRINLTFRWIYDDHSAAHHR